MQKAYSSLFMYQKLLDDLAVAFAECASCVGFICVDVHSSRKLGAYANYNIAENKASAVGVDLNGNDLLISNTYSFSICGSKVDVTLSSDNAFCDLNFACRTYELASTGARNITGFAYGCAYAESTCVGEGDLNLCSGTCGAKDDYTRNGFLGTNNGNAFFACELTGLGEVLLMGEGSAFAEKDLNVFFGKMHVACTCFN